MQEKFFGQLKFYASLFKKIRRFNYPPERKSVFSPLIKATIKKELIDFHWSDGF